MYVVLKYCLDVLVPIYSRPVQISTVNLSVGRSRRLPALEVWSTLDSGQRIVGLVEKYPPLFHSDEAQTLDDHLEPVIRYGDADPR